MKINNIYGVHFPENNNDKDKQTENLTEIQTKTAQASSLDALDTQGRAQVNFGRDYHYMSFEEYKKLKEEIKKKIKTLPENIKPLTSNWHIEAPWGNYTCTNINIAKKILSSPRLYNNPDFMKGSTFLLSLCSDSSENKPISKVLDEIINSENKAGDNEVFMKYSSDLVLSALTPDSLDLLKQIMSEPNLYGNDDFMKSAKAILQKSYKQSDVKSDLLKTISNNSDLTQDDAFMKHIGYIIANTETQQEADLIKQIITDKNFYGNDKFLYYVNDLLFYSHYSGLKPEEKEKAQSGIKLKSDLLNEIMSSGRNYKPEEITNFSKMFRYCDTKVQYEIAKKIMSDERLYGNDDFMKPAITSFFEFAKTDGQLKTASKIMSDEKFYTNPDIMKNSYMLIMSSRNEKNAEKRIAQLDKFIQLSEIFKDNENIKKYIPDMVFDSNNEFSEEILGKIVSEKRLYKNENFMQYAPSLISFANTKEKSEIVQNIMYRTAFFKDEKLMKSAVDIIKEADKPEKIQLAAKVLSNAKLYGNEKFMENTFLKFNKCFFFGKECPLDEQIKFSLDLLNDLTDPSKKLADNQLFMQYAPDLIFAANTKEQYEIIKHIMSKISLLNNEDFMKKAHDFVKYSDTPECAEVANTILSNTKLYGNKTFLGTVPGIMANTCTVETAKIKIDLLDKLKDKLSDNVYRTHNIAGLIVYANTKEQSDIANQIISNQDWFNDDKFMNYAPNIVAASNSPEKFKITNKILSEERLYKTQSLLFHIRNITENINTDKQAENLLKILDDKDFSIEQIADVIKNGEIPEYKTIKKFYKLAGKDKAASLSSNDIKIALKFIDLFKTKNINEIPRQTKKEFLKSLISLNNGLFNISEDMKQMFPLLPANQEAYCSLLPSIVRSLGIETKELSDNEITEFNNNINKMGNTLKELSDEDFRNLDIKQMYSKDDFIKYTLNKVKNLSEKERQKVYDYFGYELYKNENASYKTPDGTGFSITGYPVKLNNEEKLEQITDPDTRRVIKNLEKDVINFSQNNKVICNNKELQKEINDIIKVLPELRPAIGNIQAGMNGTEGSHEFDIFQHSLKVMQGIVKNPQYDTLNPSDKKIILLASLLHDLTKKEGESDGTHATNSSFDAFFISKKFKLTQDETIKLFNLIKHHEWLNYVNSTSVKSIEERTKRQQSIAYDLRHDNMFKMALIFTHADLKGVNSQFHDTTDGKGRTDFEGVKRSFGEAADFHAEAIKKDIEELKKSQPLLPVTKIPKASEIKEAITTVNPDGSTNIKGVYKNKDGLIVVKYNELKNEDLEKIGFPKGSITTGIKTKTSADEDVDTGNIKFFVHGLDYPNQLAKFDAFSLVDSDVLLSVSYAERPESKSRFFRPQGIILDCDTKYVHGGGNTDAGSGCGKYIQNFKDNYIFGGFREKDRTYIADLIKETLDFDDEQYIDFVKKHENDSLLEIEPEEIREKIIKAFATINSNIRKGKRAYNEMYISNPKPPMAVFAYSENYNEEIKNPVDFLNRETTEKFEHSSVKTRTEFLQKYAKENDIPFIVFGK